MQCLTAKIAGRHIATIKITGIEGGFIAGGRNPQEAIANCFRIISSHYKNKAIIIK